MGSEIHVYAHEARIGGSSAATIVDDDDGRTLGEKLESAARAVLGSVQDDVSEFLHEPWPSDQRHVMAMPGSRSDEEWLHIWYGRDERAPVVGMAAIRIAEITDAQGTTTAGA